MNTAWKQALQYHRLATQEFPFITTFQKPTGNSCDHAQVLVDRLTDGWNHVVREEGMGDKKIAHFPQSYNGKCAM